MDQSTLEDEIIHGRDDLPLDQAISHFDPRGYRRLIKRIFDINPGESLDPTSAWEGWLGRLNRWSIPRRNKVFDRRISEREDRGKRPVILAEGDSWFQYPFFLDDIVDKLTSKGRLVRSLAAGGDWIGNMVYEDEYIRELTNYQPEYFLVSGGGNDIVGSHRLATLVERVPLLSFDADLDADEQVWAETIERMGLDNGEECQSYSRAQMIVRGVRYLNKDFYSLLRVFRYMYLLTFTRVARTGKFNGMRIITQGYDFAVPSNDRSVLWQAPTRWLMNGIWLYYPLLRKGIIDHRIQRSILSALIHLFNETMIEVGRTINDDERNQGVEVWHVDNRGLLNDADWADELHPRSFAFGWITQGYEMVIQDNMPDSMRQEKVITMRRLKKAKNWVVP